MKSMDTWNISSSSSESEEEVIKEEEVNEKEKEEEEVNSSFKFKFNSVNTNTNTTNYETDLDIFVKYLKKYDKKRKFFRNYRVFYNKNNAKLTYNQLCKSFNNGCDPKNGKRVS